MNASQNSSFQQFADAFWTNKEKEKEKITFFKFESKCFLKQRKSNKLVSPLYFDYGIVTCPPECYYRLGRKTPQKRKRISLSSKEITFIPCD